MTINVVVAFGKFVSIELGQTDSEVKGWL